MTGIKSSRTTGFLIITLIYVIAVISGIFVFKYLEGNHFLIRILMADIAGTIIVWGCGVFLGNSSVYDPYWSVAPLLILLLFAIYSGTIFTGSTYVVIFPVFLWGVRLTVNWAYTFKNLNFQDWRYDYYKSEYPKLWHLINLTGINLMPTLIVFGVMVPGLLIIHTGYEINALTFFFIILCVFAVMIQTFADSQMHNFKKQKKPANMICKAGLWNYCRHPNYTGEILFWWSICGMFFSFGDFLYIIALGPLLNTIMFIFISVPLMEKKLIRNKEGYIEYIESTGMFFPNLSAIKDIGVQFRIFKGG